MHEFDQEVFEEELGFTVPDIYLMFVDAAEKFGYDLAKYNICHDTESLRMANEQLRTELQGEPLAWKSHYMYFGVGDGCGNYYLLDTSAKKVKQVHLWAHDPEGIEEVEPAKDFFKCLLAELKADFQGPEALRFDCG